MAWRWHTTWAAMPSSCLTVGLLKKATRALSVVAGTGSMTQETVVDAEDASESVSELDPDEGASPEEGASLPARAGWLGGWLELLAASRNLGTLVFLEGASPLPGFALVFAARPSEAPGGPELACALEASLEEATSLPELEPRSSLAAAAVGGSGRTGLAVSYAVAGEATSWSGFLFFGIACAGDLSGSGGALAPGPSTKWMGSPIDSPEEGERASSAPARLRGGGGGGGVLAGAGSAGPAFALGVSTDRSFWWGRNLLRLAVYLEIRGKPRRYLSRRMAWYSSSGILPSRS